MVPFGDLLRVSAQQTLRQRARYAGVMLAMTIGIVGLIVVISMGRDVKRNLNQDLDLLGGATLIKVYFNPHLPALARTAFRRETLDALRRLPGVSGVSAIALKTEHASSAVRDRRYWFVLVGVDRHFWKANSFTPSAGRLFTPDDIEGRRKVCVLGAELARSIFGEGESIGRLLPIDRDLYEVIGLLADPSIGDRNQWAFIPLTTAQDRVQGLTPVNRLYVRCADWESVRSVAEAVPATVRIGQSAEGLEVEVGWERLRYIQRIVWWIGLFIYVSIVAALCLGGFGILNGMLAAVKARTREIGLKKAMGAADRDILVEFLAEALYLSLGSAVAGIILGRLAIQGISHLLHSPPPEDLFLMCAGFSVVFAVTLGLAAGAYPSIRASRMDVVSAVRYE